MGKTRGNAARACATLVLCVAAVAGCTRPHETEDERLRRETAESTRQLRHDAQNAGVEARQAARVARRQAQDIVAGVREGWHEGAPSKGEHGRVNLNTATISELSDLPGVSAATAKRIVRHRPYAASEDLVKRSVVTQFEYDRFADHVTVHDRIGTSK